MTTAQERSVFQAGSRDGYAIVESAIAADTFAELKQALPSITLAEAAPR